jgi:hypothetical protein
MCTIHRCVPSMRRVAQHVLSQDSGAASVLEGGGNSGRQDGKGSSRRSKEFPGPNTACHDAPTKEPFAGLDPLRPIHAKSSVHHN